MSRLLRRISARLFGAVPLALLLALGLSACAVRQSPPASAPPAGSPPQPSVPPAVAPAPAPAAVEAPKAEPLKIAFRDLL